MPTVKKCCCCCGLKTGVLVLGWLSLIFAVLGVISNFVTLVSPAPTITFKFDGQESTLTTYAKSPEAAGSALGMGLFYMLCSGLLIYGAYKEKKIFLMPWLIWDMLSLIIATLLVVIIGFLFFLGNETIVIGLFIYLVGLPMLGIGLYIWLCVLSLYQKFNEEENLNKRRRHEEVGFIPNAPMDGSKPPPYPMQNV